MLWCRILQSLSCSFELRAQPLGSFNEIKVLVLDLRTAILNVRKDTLKVVFLIINVIHTFVEKSLNAEKHKRRK